jgi:toxin ParE1/3/4
VFQEISVHVARAVHNLRDVTDYCEHIARLPTQLGRPRPELGRDYRSITFGSYVIFLRYADEDRPLSHLSVKPVDEGVGDGAAFAVGLDVGGYLDNNGTAAVELVAVLRVPFDPAPRVLNHRCVAASHIVTQAGS